MNKVIEINKATLIIEEGEYYYDIKLFEGYDLGYRCDICSACNPNIIQYCDNLLKIPGDYKYLCSRLHKIGYDRTNYIRSIKPIKISLFINLLLIKLIKNYEKARFIKIEN